MSILFPISYSCGLDIEVSSVIKIILFYSVPKSAVLIYVFDQT